MSQRRDLVGAAAALTLAPASSLIRAQPAGAVTLGGVKFEPEATLGGRKLQLNGAGIRYRAVFKVYAAGFYTASKFTKNEDTFKTDAPKRMHLVALRNVSGDEFGKLFARAMENNASREEFAKSVNNVIRMGQIFADARNFSDKDVILVDYVPGTGTIISHRGKQMAEPFKEPEFHSLMMKIWFGPRPVDEQLRIALLGGQSTANS
jgi:hypothetical protein